MTHPTKTETMRERMRDILFAFQSGLKNANFEQKVEAMDITIDRLLAMMDDTLVDLAVTLQPIAQKQTDKDGNYYVTLEQLHNAIKTFQKLSIPPKQP